MNLPTRSISLTKSIFENGRYWDWKEVEFIEIQDKVELIDIDTEEDFKIAEDIYKTRRRRLDYDYNCGNRH